VQEPGTRLWVLILQCLGIGQVGDVCSGDAHGSHSARKR